MGTGIKKFYIMQRYFLECISQINACNSSISHVFNLLDVATSDCGFKEMRSRNLCLFGLFGKVIANTILIHFIF